MMEYTVNGVTYRQLKDITVKALILAHASDNDIHELSKGNRPLDDISLSEAIDYASSCNEKLQWLVDQGFVEVVEEALKPCPFCGGEAEMESHNEYWAVCNDCEGSTDMYLTKQEAIEAWNKRV